LICWFGLNYLPSAQYSVQIKNFIAMQFSQGHKKPHIMKMVQDKYGGLKNKSKRVFKND